MSSSGGILGTTTGDLKKSLKKSLKKKSSASAWSDPDREDASASDLQTLQELKVLAGKSETLGQPYSMGRRRYERIRQEGSGL